MDYVVGAITVVAMELIARRRWEGWALGLVNQTLWFTLCWKKQLWGLILIPLILTWRYSVALYRWRRDAQTIPTPLRSH